MQIKKYLVYSFFLSILAAAIFCIIYGIFNPFDSNDPSFRDNLQRDEWLFYNLAKSPESIFEKSIFQILTLRIPFLFLGIGADFLLYPNINTLLTLKTISFFFACFIFFMLSSKYLNKKNIFNSLCNVYLYFPFLALGVLAFFGQRDTMLCLIVTMLFLTEGLFKKLILLLLTFLLRPQILPIYFFGILVSKTFIPNKRYLILVLPLLSGFLIALPIQGLANQFLGWSYSQSFSLINFFDTFSSIFNLRFLFVFNDSSSIEAISSSKQILLISRFISPAVIILPFVLIRYFLKSKYFGTVGFQKITICLSTYLCYCSFSSILGFQSLRQQLPFLVSMSFLYFEYIKFNKV